MSGGGLTRGRRGKRFISVCSGIEAASVALEPLGFVPAAFAEIDKAASQLLARRFPHVRNFGDFTAIDPSEVGPVDWLIGGTPCQAFSVAGKRLSLADARGNLTLAYAVLAHELARSNGLSGALWENVPGVRNTPDNAFGCFLAALVGSERALIQPRGTGWPHTGMVDGPWARAAWIVRDAQYFGLAQRRERVFVVVGFGERVDPAKILFERAGLRGNSAPSREAREGIARPLASSPRGGSGYRNDADTAENLIVGGARGTPIVPVQTVGALSSNGGTESKHGYGMGLGILKEMSPTIKAKGPNAVAFDTTQITSAANRSNPVPGDPCHPLAAGAHPPAVAFDLRGREGGAQFEGPHDTANIRAASGGSSRSYVVVAPDDALSYKGINQTGDSNASASETDACEILRAMRQEIGEEAFTEWGLGISDSFQSAEVLRCEVHGSGIRREAGESRRELDDNASSRSQVGAAGALREMRQSGRQRRPPPGWQPSEQRSEQFAAALSELPQQGASAKGFVLDLREASEGLGVLHQALRTIQDAWRSASCENKPTHTTWAVRRLTPQECEKLQGFPPGWTEAPDENGKIQADGVRYRQLGNSMAVPVISWLGERILMAAPDSVEEERS